MPIIAPMKTLSGREFDAWYMKNRKGKSLDGAAYMALSKEDKVKAREHLKSTVEYIEMHQDIRAMYKKCYAGFFNNKKHIDGLKLARYIRDNIEKEADLDLWDNVDVVQPTAYYDEPDGGSIREVRDFVKKVNKKYPGTFKCSYTSDDKYLDIDEAEKHFPMHYLKSQVKTYNDMMKDEEDYDQIDDVDGAKYLTSILAISGTNGEKEHDRMMWSDISKTPVAKK